MIVFVFSNLDERWLWKENEQSNKYTQHISVCAIIFIMYTQKIVNQIIEILGIKKTKSG
jgi:hypothetical protein